MTDISREACENATDVMHYEADRMLVLALRAALDAAHAREQQAHDRAVALTFANDVLQAKLDAAEAEKGRAVNAAEYILDGMGIDGPEYVIAPRDEYLEAANSAWVRDTLERLAAATRKGSKP